MLTTTVSGLRPISRLGAERLTDQSVCSIVKAYAELIGLKAVGAHSPRAGFLTSAARRGASVFKMRERAWHDSPPAGARPVFPSRTRSGLVGVGVVGDWNVNAAEIKNRASSLRAPAPAPG